MARMDERCKVGHVVTVDPEHYGHLPDCHGPGCDCWKEFVRWHCDKCNPGPMETGDWGDL